MESARNSDHSGVLLCQMPLDMLASIAHAAPSLPGHTLLVLEFELVCNSLHGTHVSILS